MRHTRLELALFARLSGTKGVVFVNLYQHSVTLILVLLQCTNLLIQQILEAIFSDDLAKQICELVLDILAALIYYYFARLYFSSNIEMRKKCYTFDVRECEVAYEADKPVLLEVINAHFLDR